MTNPLLPNPVIDLARRVVEENKALGRRVEVAESCTGGLVAAFETRANELYGSSSSSAQSVA